MIHTKSILRHLLDFASPEGRVEKFQFSSYSIMAKIYGQEHRAIDGSEVIQSMNSPSPLVPQRP